MKELLLLSALTLLVSACSVSSPVNPLAILPPGPQGQNSDEWQEYADTPLAGRLFGQEWTAKVALAEFFGSDKSKLSVSFYADEPTAACGSLANPKNPYATLVIPKEYTKTEYKADFSAGTAQANPLIFTITVPTVDNLAASKTKLRVDSIGSDGFNASLFAVGIKEDGEISSVNGQIKVLDCTNGMKFSDWDKVKGSYTLLSFDGKAVNPRTVSAVYDSKNRFYSNEQGKYIKTLLIPLYFAVSDHGEGVFDFGPMETLGHSSFSSDKGVDTFKYEYSGLVTVSRTEAFLNLSLQIVKSGTTFNVEYTIEVKSHISKESHKFTLRKIGE